MALPMAHPWSICVKMNADISKIGGLWSEGAAIGAKDMGAGRVESQRRLIAGFGRKIAGTLQGERTGGGFEMDEGLVAKAFHQPDAGGQGGICGFGRG